MSTSRKRVAKSPFIEASKEDDVSPSTSKHPNTHAHGYILLYKHKYNMLLE